MTTVNIPVTFHAFKVSSQDPPPPAADPPPAPPADGGAPPPPPADGGAPPAPGGAPPAAPELIFPNLAAWKTDFMGRVDVVKKTVEDVPGDDEEVKRVKKIARDIIRTIDNRMKEIEKVVSQRTVAAQLSDQEEKLSNAGRRLFGIKWNTTPCGAGFVQSNCGKFAGC